MIDTKGRDTALRGEQRYEKLRVLHNSPKGPSIELHKDVITGELVAIKCFERGSQISRTVRSGILNHMGLKHHHIIAFKEVFLTATHLCIVMEYAAGGDTLRLAKNRKMSEAQVRWLFQQLIVGLDYCHKMGIVSRNISLENTLIDKSDWPLLKINAFTKSKRLLVDEGRYDDDLFTNYAYVAPELLTGRGIRKDEFKDIDVWACGVYLYAMLFQEYPFYDPECKGQPNQLRRALLRTMECKFIFPETVTVTEDCKDLICSILTFRKNRYTLEDIKQHPWFLKDLPKGALQMNSTLRLRKSTKFQTKEDITSTIDVARVRTPGTR